MGMCFAVTLRNGIFDATNAQKNEKLLFCVGSGETASGPPRRNLRGECFAPHRLNLCMKTGQHVHPRTTITFVQEVLSGITQYYRTCSMSTSVPVKARCLPKGRQAARWKRSTVEVETSTR